MMRSSAVIEKIDSMASTLGRRLSATDIENYLDALTGLDPDRILSACKSWMKTQKKMPAPSELRQKVIDLEDWIEKKKEPSRSELKCRYYCQTEEMASRALCENYADPADAHFSNLQFGAVYCGWHYACAYAAAFPESAAAIFTKTHLESIRSLQDRNMVGVPAENQNLRAISNEISSKWSVGI